MLFKAFATAALLAGSALAEPMPYKVERVGMMSVNMAFGLARRQNGYQPTQTLCGNGADCAAACGASYVTCPSKDDQLHCYDPTVLKETCCPDGTGNSCSEGYYCTNDSSGQTWCCPNGMDLAACAAAYGLTGSLVSQVSTSAPTSAASSSAPASASSATTSAATVKPTSTASTSVSPSGSVIQKTPSSNGTVSLTASATAVQFTGGANSAYAGLPALALAAAGAVLAL